jgi:3-oxoacyl-[acyl-carrier-protein] synthase-3
MSEKITAAITAVGAYLPEYRLTNDELATMVDTNDEWIKTRTGVEERRILKGEGKGVSDMGAPAVLELCKKRGIDPSEIDVIICCTVTADMLFPASANIIANKIGAVNCFGFDLGAACSGFLFGVTTGAAFIESGRYKKVVVVGTDKMSAITDYSDRTTCVLFGDAAAAILLEPNFEGYGVLDSLLKTDGTGEPYLHMKAGGSRKPSSIETVMAKEHFVYQEGPQVFKFAVKGIGRKTAERLVLELRDKVNKQSFDINLSSPKGNSLEQDALNALVALGISKPIAEQSVNKIIRVEPSIIHLEDLIKKALKAI